MRRASYPSSTVRSGGRSQSDRRTGHLKQRLDADGSVGAYHVPMTQVPGGTLSPNPHYYEIRGRAAEIARALGSPVGDAEHLFLGMLHDGGWPVTVISRLVDPGRAEAAVLDILNGPGYSPPAPPRFPKHDGYVHLLGAEVAYEMGASYLGLEHAFLSMIRRRETVPARALASLVDLDALEAAVLDALNAPPSGPPEDAVFLPEGQEMDGPLRRAVANALPEETTFTFGSDPDEGTWLRVIGPGDTSNLALTREVVNTALASLNRPAVDS
jgi:hypothetical protein